MRTLEDIEQNGFVLTPGRYVGIRLDEDEMAFEEKMKVYSEELAALLKNEQGVTGNIKEVFNGLNFKVWENVISRVD